MGLLFVIPFIIRRGWELAFNGSTVDVSYACGILTSSLRPQLVRARTGCNLTYRTRCN